MTSTVLSPSSKSVTPCCTQGVIPFELKAIHFLLYRDLPLNSQHAAAREHQTRAQADFGKAASLVGRKVHLAHVTVVLVLISVDA
jgi:hypothetical protein